MPLYEYECEACGHRFEVIQKVSDEPISTCPSCRGAVRKLQSAPAFHFKGTGWYVTDYARKDQSGSAKAGGGESAEGAKDSKESASKSTKPADGGAKASGSSDSTSAPSSGPSTPAKPAS